MSDDSEDYLLPENAKQEEKAKATYAKRIARYLLAKAKPIENFLQNNPINHGDIQSTWVRLMQVFGNIWANFRQALSTVKASDADNPNSFFNKMMHGGKYIINGAGKVVYTGITALGDFFIGTLIMSLVVGTLVGLYQKWHATKLLSQERLLKSKLAVAKTKAAKERLEAELKKIHDTIRDKELEVEQSNAQYTLLAKERHHGKFRFRRLKFVRREAAFTDAEIDQAGNDIEADNAAAADKTIGGKRKVTRLQWVLDAANTKVVRVLSSIWNWNVNQSMVYWLAWFVALCAVGFTAALTGAALITVNVITIGVGVLFSLGKLAQRIVTYRARRNLEKHIDELVRYPGRRATDFKYGKKFSAEESDLLDTIIEKHFVDGENPYANKAHKDIDKAAFKRFISNVAAHFNKVKANDKAARKAERVKYIQRDFINFEGEDYAEHFKQFGFEVNKDAAFAPDDAVTEKRKAFLTAQLYEQLKIEVEYDANKEANIFKSKRLNRSGLVGIRQGFVFGFVIPFFIISMIGAFLLFPALGPAIVAVGSFLLNAQAAVYIMTALGLSAGVVLGIHKFAGARQAKNDHAFKAANVLRRATYKDTGLTREDAFIERKAMLDDLINGFSEEQKAEIIKMGGADLLNKESVYNHDYFDRQRTHRGAWSHLKNVGGYIYQFLGGTQTGVLMTRFLFLSAMVLSGVIVAGVAAFSFGAPVIFFAIAAVMAVTLGTLRVIDIHQDRKIARRDGFLNNMDVRIEFLERNISLLKGVFGKFKSEKPADEAGDQAEMLNSMTKSIAKNPHGLLDSSKHRSTVVGLQAGNNNKSSTETMTETLSDNAVVNKVAETVSASLEFVDVKPNTLNTVNTLFSANAINKTCAQEMAESLESAPSNTPAAPAA